MNEVKTEIENKDKKNIEAEFGDLIFSIINAARLYGINPDDALERTNKKFIFRFNHLEKCAKEAGKNLKDKDMTLAEMDAYWNEAKELEKQNR